MNQVQPRHLAMRIAYMAACAAIVAGFGSARGDVFSDVHFWLRGGMAVDANANGRLDAGEIVDSMGRTALSSSVYDADGTLCAIANTYSFNLPQALDGKKIKVVAAAPVGNNDAEVL